MRIAIRRPGRTPLPELEFNSWRSTSDKEQAPVGPLMAHRVISVRYGIWSLSGHSGLWQAVRPADFMSSRPSHCLKSFLGQCARRAERRADCRLKDALTVILEMPGVDKNNVEVRVEDNVLNVSGRLDFSKYQGLQPLYTEYNVGNYSRSFRLSSAIDQNKIGAELKDGVLSLVLPKVEQAKPRTIQVK
jgi:HSP20 family protein